MCIIDDIGGSRAVAQLLSERTGLRISQSSVCNWRHNGVPMRFRSAVANIAIARGVRVPDEFLISSPPPTEE